MILSDITLVMLCAGSSSRFGLKPKKQWLRTGHTPLWLFVTKKLSSYYSFSKVIVVSALEELDYMQNFEDSFFISQEETLDNNRCKMLLNTLQPRML